MYFVFSKLGSMLREKPDCKKNTLLTYVLTWGSDPSESDAQSSLDSSLMTAQTYITVLKNKNQSPQTECGVDEPPVCDMCSLV